MELLLANLYLSFFKIGLFGFGGGYAMISLIQQELEHNGWLNLKQFIDVVAIAQMTPGPIAINSGTFVGFRISSIWGSLVATIGVITPSFILVLILAHFFKKVRGSDLVEVILRYLRPTVIALIVAAAFMLARTSIVDLPSLIITCCIILVMFRTNLHPIFIIILAGLSGMLIYA